MSTRFKSLQLIRSRSITATSNADWDGEKSNTLRFTFSRNVGCPVGLMRTLIVAVMRAMVVSPHDAILPNLLGLQSKTYGGKKSGIWMGEKQWLLS